MSYLYSSSSFFFDKMVNSVAWRVCVCVHRESDGTGIKLTHTPFCLLWETGRENVQQQQQPKQTGQAFGRDSSFSFISFPFLSLFLFLFFLHFFLFFHLDLQDRESCGTTHTHVTARRVQHERYQCFSFFFFLVV